MSNETKGISQSPGGLPASPFRSLDQELQSEVAAFIQSTEAHLLAIQTDFLSDGTRKDQRILLVASFLLLFVSLGSIVVGGAEIKGPGDVKLSVEGPENLKRLGFLVCLFFEVTYLFRCFSDWTSYAIRSRLAHHELGIARMETAEAPRPFDEASESLQISGKRRLQGCAPSDVHADERERSARHDRDMLALTLKKNAINRHIFRITASTHLRALLEVFFPLAFGAYALVTAYRGSTW